MSNRNDDIKQLFSHLGLNEEDYKELRRKSGGTEAERATQAGSTRSPPAPPPTTVKPATPVSGSRFDARAQPKVFLPGLTSEEGSPEQIPTRRDAPRQVDAETVRLEPKLTPSVTPVQAPADKDADQQRWPLLDAAAQASPPVAQIRRVPSPPPAAPDDATTRLRPASVPEHRQQTPVAQPTTEPAPAKVAWRGLAPRNLSATVQAESVSTTPGPSSLKRVLGRIASPKATMTDREHAPQLHYAPRMAVVDEPSASPDASDLNAVLGRLGRARR